MRGVSPHYSTINLHHRTLVESGMHHHRIQVAANSAWVVRSERVRAWVTLDYRRGTRIDNFRTVDDSRRENRFINPSWTDVVVPAVWGNQPVELRDSRRKIFIPAITSGTFPGSRLNAQWSSCNGRKRFCDIVPVRYPVPSPAVYSLVNHIFLHGCGCVLLTSETPLQPEATPSI